MFPCSRMIELPLIKCGGDGMVVRELLLHLLSGQTSQSKKVLTNGDLYGLAAAVLVT